MKVLVCGGRNFNQPARVWNELDGLLRRMPAENLILILGGATGADSHAQGWAEDRQIVHFVYPAPWRYNKREAGLLRNVQMLREGKPDLVIAFPGGPGTEHMKRISRDAGVPVHEVV